MQWIKYIHIFFLVTLFQNIFAQSSRIDSLKKQLEVSLHDCNRAELLYQLGREYQDDSQNALALRFAKQCLDLSLRLSCDSTLMHCYNLLGIAFDDNGNYPQAKKYFQTGLDLSIQLNDEKNMSVFYTNLGETFRSQADYSKAMEYFFKALKIDESQQNEQRMVSDYFTLTLLFGNLDEILQEKKYLFKALNLTKKIGNKRVEAKCYNIYAILLSDENKTDSALYYYEKSLTIARSIELKHLEAKVLSNIGGIYRDKKDYKNAIAYTNQSVDLNTMINDNKFLAADYIALGWIYEEMNDLLQSKNFFFKALELAKDRFPDSEIHSYKGLAALAAKSNNYKEAYDYHVLFKAKEDGIYNEENSKQLGDIKTNFEVEKKEAELKAEQEILRAVALEEKKQQAIIVASVAGILLIVVIFSFFLFKRYKLTNKQKEIIELKNKETEDQKTLLEEKQKEIIDSIKYAKRIQNAILPQSADLQEHLPQHFVFYQPKDIIAGDFYWMHTAGNKVFFAAADSTGHGVPGTIVSIVCSNALDKAVKEFGLIDTGKILDKTTELVLETFARSGEEINDGMDISLICIDKVNLKITWSGANNQLLYAFGNELLSVKPNKQPVGRSDSHVSFITHEIPYRQGTIFYLMTDGYQDQFGGPNGKKFKFKQLEHLVSGFCHLPLEGQLRELHSAFYNWKGNLEQVDDVTVIGIKI
ncbi:MAG: tetratricopeptide repeat protein [Bacteroidota bacterium]